MTSNWYASAMPWFVLDDATPKGECPFCRETVTLRWWQDADCQGRWRTPFCSKLCQRLYNEEMKEE